LCLDFATPKETQDHNAHDYLGGFNAEKETLYNKSGKLNKFLSEWDSKDVDTIPKRMDDLWIDLVALDQARYKLSALKRNYRNVAMIGQINYANWQAGGHMLKVLSPGHRRI
jgi:hypothetical protein